MAKPKKPYWEMDLEELRAATAEFDGEIDPKRMKPLTPVQRALFEKSIKRAGAVFESKGTRRKLQISIDSMTLQMIDAFAERSGLTRNEVIERGFRGMMAFVG